MSGGPDLGFWVCPACGWFVGIAERTQDATDRVLEDAIEEHEADRHGIKP